MASAAPRFECKRFAWRLEQSIGYSWADGLVPSAAHQWEDFAPPSVLRTEQPGPRDQKPRNQTAARTQAVATGRAIGAASLPKTQKGQVIIGYKFISGSQAAKRSLEHNDSRLKRPVRKCDFCSSSVRIDRYESHLVRDHLQAFAATTVAPSRTASPPVSAPASILNLFRSVISLLHN